MFTDCPRCNSKMLIRNRRENETVCLACGYELVLTTPVGLNADTWLRATSDKANVREPALPAYRPDFEW